MSAALSFPTPAQEDAFHWIVRFLGDPPKDDHARYGYDLYLPHAMHCYVETVHSIQDQHASHFPRISPAFYAAAWELCRRGILRPGVKEFGRQSTEAGSAGGGFSMTPFGKQWLNEGAGKFDYVPTEPGRFAQVLDQFAPRFGLGFKERSQEALRCYGAHAHLACCAMCGAAAESILLAVAIQRKGDRDTVEKMYFAAGGRGRVEKFVLGSQPSQVADEFKGYMSLLKYWRDNASHGAASNIRDNEAYTSLNVLLRFAQFAHDRWKDLTT